MSGSPPVRPAAIEHPGSAGRPMAGNERHDFSCAPGAVAGDAVEVRTTHVAPRRGER